MKQAQIVVYDGVDELDAVGPFEVLVAGGFEVELVTIDPTPIVEGAHGLALTPSGYLGPAPELLVVPGGGWLTRAREGAWAQARRASCRRRSPSGTPPAAPSPGSAPG